MAESKDPMIVRKVNNNRDTPATSILVSSKPVVVDGRLMLDHIDVNPGVKQ